MLSGTIFLLIKSERMMKKIVLFFAGIALFSCLQAQVVTVKDRQTGSPLDLVTLTSAQPHAFAVTNAEGQADIRAFKGVEKIEIRILGYKTETLSYSQIEAAGFVVMMTQTGINIDGVVVSATRWNQVSSGVPSSIIPTYGPSGWP